MYTLYYIEPDKSSTMVKKDLSLSDKGSIAQLLGSWLAHGEKWYIVDTETNKRVAETYSSGKINALYHDDFYCKKSGIIDKFAVLKAVATERALIIAQFYRTSTALVNECQLMSKNTHSTRVNRVLNDAASLTRTIIKRSF